MLAEHGNIVNILSPQMDYSYHSGCLGRVTRVGLVRNMMHKSYVDEGKGRPSQYRDLYNHMQQLPPESIDRLWRHPIEAVMQKLWAGITGAGGHGLRIIPARGRRLQVCKFFIAGEGGVRWKVRLPSQVTHIPAETLGTHCFLITKDGL